VGTGTVRAGTVPAEGSERVVDGMAGVVTAELDPDGQPTMTTAATAMMTDDATTKATVWVRGRRRW
jgi:hypothetical protein